MNGERSPLLRWERSFDPRLPEDVAGCGRRARRHCAAVSDLGRRSGPASSSKLAPCTSHSKTWRPWSSRPPVETLNLRCAGPARVLVISRTRWLAADIRSVTARWLLCFMDWTTVCRPTERRERGLLIPTATPSSSTSARKSVRSKHSNSRSYQSIRKRRNWSEISEMSAWNGSPKGRRTRSASTTSKTRNLARRFRTASMTSPTTKVG